MVQTTAKRKLRVLITAGPTRAYLDRFRFLTNYSSGKLGFEIARVLSKSQVEVMVVVGPTSQPFHRLHLKKVVPVETVKEMEQATLSMCRRFRPHFAIFSAAVLDFQPRNMLPGKVSSKRSEWVLKLIPTPKIIDRVAKEFPEIKRIGFKLEWKALGKKEIQELGIRLLKQKGLNAVCINFLSQMKGDSHPVWFVTQDSQITQFHTKLDLAKALAGHIKQPRGVKKKKA